VLVGDSTVRRWTIGGLIGYAVAVGVVLLSPVSFGGIVAAIGGWLSDGLGLDWFGSGWIEFIANALMFVPLGFLLTLLLRHPVGGMALAVLLSACAEIAQVVIPSRQPSLRDLLANALGALVGAGLARLIVLRRRRDSSVRARGENDGAG
jgi:glycopeptide antibiotics resistance protein